MRTKDEIQATEVAAIESFKKDFDSLCEKHGINAIVFGARKESEKFDLEGKSVSMAAAFASSNINKKANISELKAIDSAFDSVKENIIAPMHRDIIRKMFENDGIDFSQLAQDLGKAFCKAFGKEEKSEESSEKKEV